MSTKVLVADHQEVMRAGLKALLGRSNIDICGEPVNERQLMSLAKQASPDVVILDVRFAEDDGFATLERLHERFPKLPVLLWSTGDNPTYMARGMALGAWGFLPRGMNRRELLAAIRKAGEGKQVWTDEQMRTFTGGAEMPNGMQVHLTPRERDVIRQLGYGLPNKEIALALEISFETVKEHIQNIMRKLRFHDRVQIAVWAVRNNLC